MLNENLKQLRKSKGLTQEEFATQLNVVRQTISKWEKGISVPDSEMLIKISEKFEVPVSALLGKTIESTEKADMVEIISDKLAHINEQLAKTAERKRRFARFFAFAGLAVVIGYLTRQVVAIIYSHILSFSSENVSTSIIGGADKPDSIFISASGINAIGIVIIVAILIISICGICLTRKK